MGVEGCRVFQGEAVQGLGFREGLRPNGVSDNNVFGEFEGLGVFCCTCFCGTNVQRIWGLSDAIEAAGEGQPTQTFHIYIFVYICIYEGYRTSGPHAAYPIRGLVPNTSPKPALQFQFRIS